MYYICNFYVDINYDVCYLWSENDQNQRPLIDPEDHTRLPKMESFCLIEIIGIEYVKIVTKIGTDFSNIFFKVYELPDHKLDSPKDGLLTRIPLHLLLPFL